MRLTSLASLARLSRRASLAVLALQLARSFCAFFDPRDQRARKPLAERRNSLEWRDLRPFAAPPASSLDSAKSQQVACSPEARETLAGRASERASDPLSVSRFFAGRPAGNKWPAGSLQVRRTTPTSPAREGVGRKSTWRGRDRCACAGIGHVRLGAAGASNSLARNLAALQQQQQQQQSSSMVARRGKYSCA